MDYRDYYQTLGVPRTASQAEIKKAFRKLAREVHPDLKPGDKTAERRFKDINEANEVLSDPEKRSRYDALGADWERYSRAGAGASGDPFAPGGPFAGFGGAGGGGGNVRYEFRTADAGGFSDFFRMFFSGGEPGARQTAGSRQEDARRRAQATAGSGSFEEILGDLGFDATGRAGDGGAAAGSRAAGGRVRSGEAGRSHETVEATAELGLEEAFHGTKRIVEVDGKRLEVNIPRGVDTGSRIRLTGRGGDGRDLYVVTRVRPHPVFTRHGADLHRELQLTLHEALLGAEVPVVTLRGRVLLTIPAGAQTGRVFRLKGQGMPRLNGEGAGDLYAKLRVVIPSGLTPEATEAARTFLDLIDQPDPRTTTP